MRSGGVRAVKSEVKQLEDKVVTFNQRKPCDVTFHTYAGTITLSVEDIAGIDLKELKELVRSLSRVAEKVSDKNKYSKLVGMYLSSLIYMGNVIRQTKEEGHDWYIECLSDLVKVKEATAAVSQEPKG
jgi:hypothetical protein